MATIFVPRDDRECRQFINEIDVPLSRPDVGSVFVQGRLEETSHLTLKVKLNIFLIAMSIHIIGTLPYFIIVIVFLKNVPAVSNHTI